MSLRLALTHGQVLNAFRHRGEGNQLGRAAPLLFGIRVLNAFRHRGEGNFTRACLAPVLGAGAQRLSASRRRKQDDVPRLPRHLCGCSTPFGIEAKETFLSSSLAVSALSCAQRLSASRRRKPSTEQGRQSPPTAYVLNAFRHRGEGNQSLGAFAAPVLRVLNAFRHRGEGNVEPVEVDVPDPDVCSTPFGIEAKETE